MNANTCRRAAHKLPRNLVLFTASLLLAACGSPKEAAYRSFSEAYSCPENRITIEAIKDVTMTELWLRAHPEPDPPAEIRADPARLAVWKKARQKNLEGLMRGLRQYELFHASGCGHEVDYACFCPPQTKGASNGRGTPQDHCGCEVPPATIAAHAIHG